MLHFQGIRTNRQGAPERYSLRYDLIRSLDAVRTIYRHFDGEKESVLGSIEQSLTDHFSSGQGFGVKAENRKIAAQWLRARDIAHFLFSEPLLVSLKAQVFDVVAEPKPIEEKWQQIRDLMLEGLEIMSVDQAQETLLDPNSGWHLLLDAVSLFFLDQDDERPPQHLEMSFISKQFPERVWKQKDALSPATDPFWKPGNPLCHRLVLEQLVLERLYEQRVLQLSQSAVEQPVQIDQTLARIRFSTDDQATELVAQSPSETLLGLQKEVQRKFSHEGSKHLLAILLQLGAARSDRLEFSLDEHFELLGKKHKTKKLSRRQQELFEGVLKMVTQVQVLRDSGDIEAENPLLTTWTKRSQPGILGSVELILDPLCRAIGLGKHLQWMPKAVFLENSQTHGLAPGLLAYLCGCWQLEFPQKQGVYACKATQLVDAFVLQKSTNQKLSFIERIKQELSYMRKRSYISDFQVESGENPFEARFQITAPTTLLDNWAVSPPHLAL